MATRAGVSVTWYTWLEQGRGGPPSDAVLERLAHGLELDSDAREILFLLAQQRPPPLSPTATPPVPAALQHVLDALTTSPAIVKTPTWDIVAWNPAATAVLANYAELTGRERNVLWRLFSDARLREVLPDGEDNARFAVGVFRIDVARAGGNAEANALAAELLATSADFRRLWARNDVHSHGAGVKRIHHPVVGPLALETSAFAVGGAEGLTMIVFTPTSPADIAAVTSLLPRRPG